MYKVLEKIQLPDGLLQVTIRRDDDRYTWLRRTIEDVEGATDKQIIDRVLEVVDEELNPESAITRLKEEYRKLRDEQQAQIEEVKSIMIDLEKQKLSLQATQAAMVDITLSGLGEKPSEIPEDLPLDPPADTPEGGDQ